MPNQEGVGEAPEVESQEPLPVPVRASAPAPAAAPQYVTTKQFFTTLVIVSLAVSALTVFVYDRFYSMRIASFDLPGHMLSVRNDLAAKVSTNQLTNEQAMDMYGKDLDNVKKTIDSMPGNVLVISGDVVLGSPRRLIKIGDSANPQGGSNVPGKAAAPLQK